MSFLARFRFRVMRELVATALSLKLLQYLVDREAGCLLTRWVFGEGCQEIPHHRLRRHHQVNVIEYPIPVGVRGYIRPLIRIRSQVEELRKPQRHQWLLPDL